MFKHLKPRYSTGAVDGKVISVQGNGSPGTYSLDCLPETCQKIYLSGETVQRKRPGCSLIFILKIDKSFLF